MRTTGLSLKEGIPGISTAVALTGGVFSTRITVADMAAADMLIVDMGGRVMPTGADLVDMGDMPFAVVVSKTMAVVDIAVALNVADMGTVVVVAMGAMAAADMATDTGREPTLPFLFSNSYKRRTDNCPARIQRNRGVKQGQDPSGS